MRVLMPPIILSDAAIPSHCPVLVASLVDSLPPEILAIILLTAAPAVRSRYVIPWEVTVSHVCQRWRSIALNTPLMWTKIRISSCQSLDRVSSYFSRSQPCPVDVWFDLWQMDRQIRSPGWVDPILDISIRDISRWASLFVFAYRKSTTNTILSRIADLSAPLLWRIRIIDDGDSSGEIIPCWRKHILAAGAPRLVTVQMDRIHYLPLLANVTTLYLQTATQSFFKVGTSVVSALAEACPFLATLSITGSFVSEDADWDIDRPPVTTMQSLCCLRFSNDIEDKLPAHFLMTVSLPQLTSLWLDLPDCHLRVLHLLSTHTFRPTFPRLRYLTLQSFDFYPASQAAKLFPTVTAVHFPWCKAFHVPFLKNTLCGDQPYWVEVDTLVFRTSHDSHLKKFSEVVRDITRQRASEATPIRRLLVDKNLLRKLLAAGLTGTVEQLTGRNYEDPWWIMAQQTHDDEFFSPTPPS